VIETKDQELNLQRMTYGDWWDCVFDNFSPVGTKKEIFSYPYKALPAYCAS
jgi:hypothetical protein